MRPVRNVVNLLLGLVIGPMLENLLSGAFFGRRELTVRVLLGLIVQLPSVSGQEDRIAVAIHPHGRAVAVDRGHRVEGAP